MVDDPSLAAPGGRRRAARALGVALLAWIAALAGAPAAALVAQAPTILVVGDSLSAGYGFGLERGWVNLLRGRLTQRGFAHQVVNASISGDTTQGGRNRLPAALDLHRPDIVVLELGANDGLRGIPLDHVAANLAAMIEASRAAGARVLLLGMRLPPNYGPAYTKRFEAMYRQLAAEHDTGLVPFLLEGVGGVPALVQPDGLHPTAEAQQRLLDNVWPHLEPML